MVYGKMVRNRSQLAGEVLIGMCGTKHERSSDRKEKLPQVHSKEEILSIIAHTNNIKHKCIVKLLYSGGLSRNELLNLVPERY